MLENLAAVKLGVLHLLFQNITHLFKNVFKLILSIQLKVWSLVLLL